MKIQNVLTNTLLCAALTAAPIFSSFAEDSDGGLSGGGGGTTARLNDEASDDDIKLIVKNLKLLMQMRVANQQNNIFNNRQIGNTRPVFESYFYPNTNRIIGAIGTVKVADQKLPCYHPSQPGVPLEGAAFPEKNEICLSVGEIKKKNHTRGQIAQKILGLYAHELYHIMNPSKNAAQEKAIHDQAWNFQGVLELSVGNLDIQHALYKYKEQRKDAFNTLLDATEIIKANQEQFDLVGFCSLIVQFATDPMDSRFDEYPGQFNGLSPNSHKMVSINDALNAKFMNFASVCFPNGQIVFHSENDKKTLPLLTVFGTSQSLSIAEYQRALNSTLQKLFMTPESSDYISYLSADELQKMQVATLRRYGIEQLIVRKLTRDRVDLISLEMKDTIDLLSRYATELKKLPEAVELN